jgi:8-oxo-dGTP pyrophosphatase MutT (NUDIX family)
MDKPRSLARLLAMITAIFHPEPPPATPYAGAMSTPIALRRLAYRVAHRLLRMWWFVRRPALHGVKCVLTDEDRVLLVRHTYGHRSWDLPGGNVRRSEVVHDAATREIEEELGIRVQHWDALGDILRISYGCQDTLHCFHAEVGDPELVLNGAEIADAHWFSERELPPKVGRHVQPILARTAAFRASAGNVQRDR